MSRPDRSNVEDEFIQAAWRIMERSAKLSPPVKRVYKPPKQVHPRLNPSLANNSTSGRSKVAQEKKCRICASAENLSRHHLVPQDWFMRRKHELRVLRNANANIVPLCRDCHDLVDNRGKAPVVKLQARAKLRAVLGTNEIAFILQVRGQQWLDEHYPREP